MGINIQQMAEYESLKEGKKSEMKQEGVQWVKPVPIDEYELPVFPVHVFPVWLRDYVKGVAESTQTPIDAAGMATISVLSTTLMKKFYVKLSGEWSESLNTYSIISLPSGNRKSAVFKALQEPITIFEQQERERLGLKVSKQKAILKAKRKRLERHEKEYAKNGEEATLKEIKDLTNEIQEEKLLTIPRYITEDVTPEKLADLLAENNEKMAILSAEGGGIFSIMAGRYSSDGKANIEIFLKGFSGDYCAVDRIGRAAKVLRNPALTIGLFVQPHVVQDTPPSFQERGLMPRFLYSFPKSLVGNRKIRPESIKEEVKNAYSTTIRNLLSFEVPDPIQLTLDENARRLEETLREDVESMFLEGGDLAEMKEWGSKLAGQIIRVAGLLHVADYANELPFSNTKIEEISPQINELTFSRARQLTKYFIEHAKAAYDCMKADRRTEDVKYLLNVIKKKQKSVIEYREIQMLTRKRFYRAEHLKNTLFDLEDRGYIRKKEGRKKVYQVNPYFLS
ncbi:YfjI family protein [Pseudalkalibacillus salsuginis]|uniref:YfjI family protein n=1 Tax=Pseudalkalibacillus salsuginis TaxID=2910972 RepID=UPI001F2C1996|nr:YfjI family protein [Pseudalkalibacillus salsuginis]MCF6409008.1 DUF3987 domain-containing protein [Pseudalkalibacillus salsuginis]